jgi:malic enzyme
LAGDDFAIWYTPGVAAACRDIEAHPEKVIKILERRRKEIRKAAIEMLKKVKEKMGLGI